MRDIYAGVIGNTLLGMALLFLAAAPPKVTAEPSSGSQEIEALKRQLHDLQARVERLESNVAEGLPVDPARTVQPAPGGWREASNWRLLAKGMDKAEVVRILGQPQSRKTVSKHEFWRYGDGTVRLYLARLKSWELPARTDER